MAAAWVIVRNLGMMSIRRWLEELPTLQLHLSPHVAITVQHASNMPLVFTLGARLHKLACYRYRKQTVLIRGKLSAYLALEAALLGEQEPVSAGR